MKETSKPARDELEEEKKESFNWLCRQNRGPTYISYSPFSKLSATSFDFGAKGCAASCNAGGELLHLAAPSEKDGLIFVRGDFQNSLYSSLARAQREFGGPSTFGFEVAVGRGYYIPDDDKSKHGSSFVLGEMIEHGSFNYRWPFNEYSLLLNDGSKARTGTCVMFSFIQGGILYQVIRIEGGSPQDSVRSRPFPEQSQIALNIGGPLWFQSFAPSGRLDGRALNGKGDVRDISTRSCIRILDTWYGLGLETKVFQLCRDGSGDHYKQLDLTESLLPVDSGPEAGETYNYHIPAYTAFGGLRRLPNSEERQDATFLAAIRLTEVSQVRKWIERKSKASIGGTWDGEFVPGIKEEDWIKRSDTTESWQERQPHEMECLAEEWSGEIWPEVKGDWPELPTSKEIYEYVGVSPNSEYATGAMWETAFLERERKTDSPSELAEVRLLGRCLEKILQVDLVPEPNISEGLALVSNIFSWPNVDLKAMFWKVRYLVKVYNFLTNLSRRYPGDGIHKRETGRSTIHPETERQYRGDEDSNATPDLRHQNVDQDEMLSIAKHQLDRIQKCIEAVVKYLVHALLTRKSDTVLMPDDFVPGESNYYYVMITIWYVAKNYPHGERIKDICKKSDNTKPRLYEITRLPKDNCNFGKDARDRIPLLMWYHYGALWSLCERGFLGPKWKQDGLEWKVARLAKVANISTAAKLSANQTYAPDDEIVDRLAFLAHELGFEHSDGTLGTVTSLTKRRIKQRDFTRFINPGCLSPLEEGSISSPWEIHALCHHSRLVVFDLENTNDGRFMAENTENFEEYKDKLCEFMNSEATIVPCWEREHSKAFKGWLRSEVTAVVASTLLKLRGEEIVTAPKPKAKPQIKHKRKNNQKGKVVASLVPSRKNSIFENAPMLLPSGGEKQPSGHGPHSPRHTAGSDRVVQELTYMEHRMDQELQFLAKLTGQATLPPKLDWFTFRPPHKFHPDNFTMSLEDTPQFYKPDYTNNFRIPIALAKFVETPGEEGPGEMGLCIDDLKEAIKKNQGSVSVSDLVAMNHEISSGQRIFMDHSSAHTAGTIKHFYQAKLTKLHETIAITRKSEDRTSPEIREKALARSLFDSLVDQQVQHRFLAVRKLSKHLLQMLLYVIHPEATPCLNNHVLCLSRFSCQNGNMWTARITLRSWIPENSGTVNANPSLPDSGEEAPSSEQEAPIILPKPPEELSDADDDAPIIYPKAFEHIERLQLNNATGADLETEKPKTFRLTVSSLIISTNAFGDFSKCTLISETIDDSRLVSFVSECQTLWQKFVNQPQTARCLIFLLALGVMCERLVDQYNEAIEAYSNILNLDDVFFKVEADGSDWEKDQKSIPQFQIGLWSLEALYKLQRSLRESVGSVLQAKKELLIQINEGPGRRSVPLQRMCDESLAEFESRLVTLTAVNSNLNRKIELSSRYKNALSAVLALRDGRASLAQNDLSNKQMTLSIAQNELAIKQNSTIERLTYLTIAYLPISLMAAIFAIPSDTPVLFPHLGRAPTVILIFVILTITYGMAFYLKRILEHIRQDASSASSPASALSPASASAPTPTSASSPSSPPTSLHARPSHPNFPSFWKTPVEIWKSLTPNEGKESLPR